jgi:hypothetical protein
LLGEEIQGITESIRIRLPGKPYGENPAERLLVPRLVNLTRGLS